MFTAVGWRVCNLSFALTCCTICHELVGWGGLEIQKRIPFSSLTPVWYHLPSHRAADCHTVLRLWLMKLLVALYLRRPFHSGARWSQGLHTHKDTYNQEGNPYLSTGHSPLPPSPHYFTTSVASLPERPWLSLCGPVFGFASLHPLIWWTDAFFKKRRYKTWFNPLSLNIRCQGH